MDVKDQYMDVTTKIWTLKARFGRYDQDMDATTKNWTFRPRYGCYAQEMDVKDQYMVAKTTLRPRYRPRYGY